MIEKNIGVPCEFEEEAIEYCLEQKEFKNRTLQQAITEYKKIYGNKKPSRSQ